MLARVTAAEYVRPTSQGRTCPSVVVCEKEDGTFVEIVAKFSAHCDQGVTNLVREVTAGCLAGALGLPVPEPFLIDVPAGWADTIADATQRAKIKASSPVAFGSRMITGQYSAWTSTTRIDEEMVDTAAAILTFDGIIQNPDRRAINPNCIVRGRNIRIFDHELCFMHGVIIGWRPPWIVGGLNALETPGYHIFRPGLRRRPLDFDPIEAAWAGVSDQKVADFEAAIPAEWGGGDAAKQATQLIKDARDNIRGCVTELKRVLA